MSTRKVCFSLPAGSVELAQSRPLFPCPASMSNVFLMSLGKYWLIWSLFICTGSTGRGGVKSPRSSPSYSSSSPSSPASTLTLRSSANRTLSPFLLAIRSITSWSCAAVRALSKLCFASLFSSTQTAKGEPGMSGNVIPNLSMSLFESMVHPTAKEATPNFKAPF